jgi:hypothetical protein
VSFDSRGVSFDSLEKLLEPAGAAEFLDSAWGRTFRHVRGGAGKFAPLLPWAALNEILRRHRLDYPRLRLMKDGARLPTNTYLRHAGGASRRPAVARLLPTGFTSALRDGATLVLDAADELHAPLEELAEALELRFHERVQVNLYAGWRTSRGFDLHWDDHDVFILQVAGRKRWRLHGETRPSPVAGERDVTPEPEGAPLWEETLEDGDLLYIPRGWWHVALPLDEPTLHLTVGVHKRTGLDLARWLAERLSRREVFRRDLPRLASEDEKRAHAEALRAALLEEWDDDAAGRYLAELDALAAPRPRVSLPWAATPELLPAGPGAVVRWTPPRPVEFKVENGVVEFLCLKRRWRFAEEALAVLGPLAERRVCALAELCEGAAGRVEERRVRALVGELIKHGLAAVVEA